MLYPITTDAFFPDQVLKIIYCMFSLDYLPNKIFDIKFP